MRSIALSGFLVAFSVMPQLELSTGSYKFDGDLLIVEQVGALEYYTKGPLADLLANSIVYSNDIGR